MVMRQLSVVIPARNAAATLAETLQTVLAEDEVGEVIVVDDGSTDRTAAVARSVEDPRIKIVPGPQQGVAAALNTGFDAATYEFVARCDADDLIVPGRFSHQCAWLAAHPEFIAVIGSFSSMSPSGRKLSNLRFSDREQEVTDSLTGSETSLCCWLTRTKAIHAVGGARPWFETAEDIDLQLRLVSYGRAWYDPRDVYQYRLQDNSMTRSRSPEQLAFYDYWAAEFARQRRVTGTDDLDAGHPPPKPAFTDPRPNRQRLKQQMRNHLNGQAWADFSEGRMRSAVGNLVYALRLEPLSVDIWRSLIIMPIKMLRSPPSRTKHSTQPPHEK